MASANRTPSPNTRVANPERDHAADSDDSLSRKKQRMSEEPEPLIEALEPEDIRGDQDTAITIEDDAGSDMFPISTNYSEGLELYPCNLSASDQLKKLVNYIDNQYYVNATWLVNLSTWLNDHIASTATECQLWQRRYQEDDAFFINLMVAVMRLLNCVDILDPKYLTQHNIDLLQVAVLELYEGLAKLSLRMVSFLPNILDGVVARRDSTQPATAGVQRVPFLWYIAVLGKLLDSRTPSSRHFEHVLGLDISLLASKVANIVLVDRTAIVALNAVLRSLSARPRDFDEAWPGIHGTVATLALSMQKAKQPFHTGPDNKQIIEFVMTVNEYIVPTVCQKHPRALPADFHDDLVFHVSSLLERTVACRDAKSTLDIYQSVCRPDQDNIASALVEGEVTEEKLLEACNKDQSILAETIKNLWLLQTLKGYVSTDILDIRSKGIVSLRQLLTSAFNTHVVRVEGTNIPKDTSHPVLRHLARFLRKGDIVEYIFSADSHANLVKECSDVVGFLAATSTYTDHESDVIWRAATTSVEAEFVKASFDVMKTMSQYMEPGQLLYVVGKYRQTAAAQIGPFAVNFLGEVLVTIRSKLHDSKDNAMRLLPARLCFDLLKSLDLDATAPSTAPLRRLALGQVLEVASLQDGPDHCASIYDMCLIEVKGRTVHSTTALETLSHLFKSQAVNDTERILEKFSVTDAVDELVDCVRNANNGKLGNHHTTRSAVHTRLQVVLRLIGMSEESEGADIEERLWAYTVGEHALDSFARESALDTFIGISGEVARPGNIKNLFNRCTNEYLPTMPVECATMRLVTFLHQSAKQEWECAVVKPDSDQRSLRLWNELVRVAVTSPSDGIAMEANKALCDVLFSTYPSASGSEQIARRVFFVRQHVKYVSSLQGKELNQGQCKTLMLRGISILEAMHLASKNLTANAKSASGAATIDLSGSDNNSELLTLRMLVHGPASSPKEVNVHCRSTCTGGALNTAFAKITGAEDHDIMHNGTRIQLVDASSVTLADMNIASLSSIILRPKFTFQSDFGRILATEDIVEKEVLDEFEELKALLSDDDLVGEKMFHFLSRIPPPTATRRRVVGSDGDLDEIFPRDNTWHSMYSIHVLSVQLQDCNSLGVADPRFILHGAKTLSGLLLDARRAPSRRLLWKTMVVLRAFLQERPQQSPPPPYLDEPTQLALRLFDIIGGFMASSADEVLTVPSPDSLSRVELVKLAYTTFIDIARTEDVWQHVGHTQAFVDVHEKLMLNRDMRLARDISSMVETLIKDAPDLTSSAFLRMIVTLLPSALQYDGCVDAFFAAYRSIIMSTTQDESQLRTLITTLAHAMWQHPHTESPDLAVLDRSYAGLLGALRDTINVLKSHKKPMHIGSLGKEVLRCLLVLGDGSGKRPTPESANGTPPKAASTATSLALRPHGTGPATSSEIDESSSSQSETWQEVEDSQMPLVFPLVHPQSRAICFEIVIKTCESTEDYKWIIQQITLISAYGERAAGRFSPGSWLRETGACAGLTNLGMTCYMNSLLQQMFLNIELRQFIFSVSITNPERQGFLVHLRKLFAQMQAYDAPYIETYELAKYLGCDVNNQEDVHGFYNDFIGKLERCIPEAESRMAFSRMFSGKLIMQIKGACGHVSSKADPFSDISLTVQNKTNLADSLSEYVQGEPMQGANKYKCLSCDGESGGKLVDAMKRECLEEVPDHLTVCLKRCTFDMLGQESKINDYFEFPEEIDMSRYELEHLQDMSAAVEPDMFRLVGVIVHSGILSFGHYWSYVLVRGFSDPKQAYWVRLEDRACRRATGFDEIRNECFGGSNRAHNGYVLFYQRQSSFERASESAVQLPGDVASLLPPRAALPAEIAQEIHDANVRKHRAAQLFEHEYHALTLRLLQDPDDFGSAEHKQDDVQACDPKKDGSSEASESSASDTTKDLLAKLAHSYLVHVALSDKLPNKTAEVRKAFCKKAASQSGLARRFLTCVRADGAFFESYFPHHDQTARNEVKGFVLDCLGLVQEQEPQAYLDVVRQLVATHSALLKRLDQMMGRWFDYFVLAWDISIRGAKEREIVARAPYLEWICEAFKAGVGLASQLVTLPELVRKRRVIEWDPVFEYLRAFFSVDGALDDVHMFSNGSYAHADRLVILTDAGGNTRPLTWVLLAADIEFSSSQSQHWQAWSAAKLVTVFAGASDWRISDAVYRTLKHCCSRDVPAQPLASLITAYISARPDDNIEAAELLQAYAGNLLEYESEVRVPIRATLEFFDNVFGAIPMAVISTMPALADEWLLPDRRGPKMTENWLYRCLFEPEPLTRIDNTDVFGSQLDVHRSETARQLVANCSIRLNDQHEINDGICAPQMLSAMQRAQMYFARLLADCQKLQNESEGEARLSQDMATEYPEAHRVYRDLRGRLARWQAVSEEEAGVDEYDDWDSDSVLDTEDDAEEFA